MSLFQCDKIKGMAGRRSKFNAVMQDQMLSLYKAGKTDAEVAKAVSVSVRTIHNWKAGNSAFFHSIREAKAVIDGFVEAALFRRAMGYTHTAEKVFFWRGTVYRVETIKHYPPDPKSIALWLRNRCPERWRW
jgi:hypothetical protein